MTLAHPDLREIAEAAAVVAPDRYRLLGSERHLQARPAEPEAAAAAPSMMLQSLESEMYYRLYRRPGDPLPGDPPSAGIDTMRGFTAALSRANCGTGTWDPGWQIQAELPDGELLVRRDDATYRAAADEVRRNGADTACRVRVPKEMRQLVRAFYMALGDADWPAPLDAPGALLRFYWSLSAQAAPLYLAQATRLLNGLGMPFRTKVIQDPSGYRGADAGVLYVPAAWLDTVRPVLPDLYESVRAGLRPQVPMFAQRIADGLGYAEDPGGGLSFGQARCRLAAAGLLRAFEAGAGDVEGRVAHLAAAFRDGDVDPERPFRALSSKLPSPGPWGAAGG